MAGHGGARPGSGRKRGIGLNATIEKHVYNFMVELLKDDVVRKKATEQLSLKLFEEEEESYIYIIKNNNLYKIGYSSNVDKRVSHYRTHLGMVDLIVVYKTKNAFHIESTFHEAYKKKSLRPNGNNSEWYEFNNEEIIDAIRYLTKAVYGI